MKNERWWGNGSLVLSAVEFEALVRNPSGDAESAI